MPVATVVPSYRTVCILSYNIHNILLASILLLHIICSGGRLSVVKTGSHTKAKVFNRRARAGGFVVGQSDTRAHGGGAIRMF